MHRQGSAAAPGPGGRAAPEGQSAEVTNVVLPVVEEELEVSRREVERGGGGVRSRVVERPVEEVAVNKEAGERTETVRDTVRSTDVEVEEVDTPKRTRGAGGGRQAPQPGTG